MRLAVLAAAALAALHAHGQTPAPAPIRPAYDHPIFRSQFVVASLSTRGYWMPLRIAGAQARRVLLDAVAARWGVPVDQLTTEPGVVVHAASGRRIGYGEVASFATVPATLPEIAPAALKPVASFRLIGRTSIA